MAKASKRPIAVFPIKKLGRIGDFILRVRTICLNITNNPLLFVMPDPKPSDVIIDVDALQVAETTAETRVTGSAAARDLQYDKVLDDVHNMQGYVQKLADQATDTATAIQIIESSGFDLKSLVVRVKAPLAVKQGDLSGSIKLVAKAAAKRASNEWRQSSDDITWAELPPTLQAKTTVIGLTPGHTYYFSTRPVLKTGAGNWSITVSIIVV